MKENVGIYIHIPFCVKKCAYCDFLSMPANDFIKNEYLNSLKKDIEKTVELLKEKEYHTDTIFIGGGTPSSLSLQQLKKLCEYVQYIVDETGIHENIETNMAQNYLNNSFGKKTERKINMEISMECNPGTLDEEKVKILKEYGINRVSLGLQSTNDTELKLLGRIHNYNDFLKSFDLLRDNGFENINVDLMSALPKQTVASWENTVKTVAALSPEHISAYSLIVEEGTPFFEKYYEDDLKRANGEIPNILPDEESERIMYEHTKQILKNYGYDRYEISNYAKKDFECRHNIGYWTGKPYIGVGLGAASLFENRRFVRQKDMKKYINGDFLEHEVEQLDLVSKMEEFMFLGLRMMCGVSKENFQQRFGIKIEEKYGSQLDKLKKEGLITEYSRYMDNNENIWIRLTEKGIDVSNYVFSEFV